ncbi:hypothetical protein WH357_21355 [Enterobacter ludwigii]
MKRLYLILALAMTGCATHTDRAGNVDDYPLNVQQASQVARNVTGELSQRYPARTLFSFPHDTTSIFATALEQSIRSAGMGITTEDVSGYHRLRYRMQRLNSHQFFVVMTVNQTHFDTVWSDDDGTLSRLRTVTQYEVSHE